MRIAAATAPSMSSAVVSSVRASAAGTSGATVAGAVALVAALDVGKDRGLVGRLTGSAQFERAATRALFRRRGDEDLHVRVRADHRADVAPVEHRAGRHGGKLALEGEQRGAHLRNRRHDRGGLADCVTLQRVLVECAPDRAPCAAAMACALSSSGRPASMQRLGDRAIEQPGVEMAQAEMRREALAERALARRGRSVDRDDHA